MPPKAGPIRTWWPSTQSLDLVEGPVRPVTRALEVEVSRILAGERVVNSWQRFEDLDAVFRSAPDFGNVPTFFVALPTRSKWTVLWNNSFLCDGYDSLCWCLTSHHYLTTIHWSANDDWTTHQAGATFTYRKHDGANVVERSVYCGQEDERWMFHTTGQPLDEENTSEYAARRKKDRLNEQSLLCLAALARGHGQRISMRYRSRSALRFRGHLPQPPCSSERANRYCILVAANDWSRPAGYCLAVPLFPWDNASHSSGGRFGSLADIPGRSGQACATPQSGRR